MSDKVQGLWNFVSDSWDFPDEKIGYARRTYQSGIELSPTRWDIAPMYKNFFEMNSTVHK